jgi:hypothetical protein
LRRHPKRIVEKTAEVEEEDCTCDVGIGLCPVHLEDVLLPEEMKDDGGDEDEDWEDYSQCDPEEMLDYEDDEDDEDDEEE